MNLVYYWTINKLFIRESLVLNVKYSITGIKHAFNQTVIMNDSFVMIVSMDITGLTEHQSVTLNLQ